MWIEGREGIKEANKAIQATSRRPRLMANVEPVEKVNLARIRRVGRKCNLSGCSVYDDLMLGRGQEAPENHPLNVMRGFFYRLVSSHGGWLAKILTTGLNMVLYKDWR